MKTIVLLITIMFFTNGTTGGIVDVYVDMESCLEEKRELMSTHHRDYAYQCIEITKEEMENPKGRHEDYEMEGA